MALLLNEHPNAAIGFERFKRVRGLLEPFHFAPEVFCNPVPTETDVFVPGFYEYLAAKFERGSVTVVGDKVPLYTDVLGHLDETFSGCRVVLTVRELEPTAASFRARASDPSDVWADENDETAAPRFWNGALRAAREFESNGNGDRLLLVPSEELFDGNREWLDAILDFLELPPSDGVARAYDEMVDAARTRASSLKRRLTAAQRKRVLSQREDELDAWWRQRVEQQASMFQVGAEQRRARWGAGNDVKPTPLPSKMRDQLFQALTHPSKEADELTELERRAAKQMREIAERGQQLKTLEGELTTTRRELSRSMRARDELTVQMNEVTAQSAATRERLSGQLAEYDAELKTVQRELNRAKQELSAITDQADQLRAELSQGERVRDELLEHLAEHERRLGQRDSELEETRGERDRARARIKTEVQKAREQREQLIARNQELERRLAARAEELEVAARQLASLEATTATLQHAFDDVRAEAAETRTDRARLLEQIEILSRHKGGLDRALMDAERRERDLSGRLAELELDLERREQHLDELEQEVTATNARLDELQQEREQIAIDVRRAANSRAWRWGHAFTTALATVTFRRKSKRGALDVLVQQLEPHALPPAPDSGSETPHGEP